MPSIFPRILREQFPELNIKVNVACYAFIIFIVQLSPPKWRGGTHKVTLFLIRIKFLYCLLLYQCCLQAWKYSHKQFLGLMNFPLYIVKQIWCYYQCRDVEQSSNRVGMIACVICRVGGGGLWELQWIKLLSKE